MLQKEFSRLILEYGPLNMAFKLKKRNLITSTQYEQLSNISISKHKSLVLVSFIFAKFYNQTHYMEYIEILSSDRRMWPLSIKLSEIS